MRRLRYETVTLWKLIHFETHTLCDAMFCDVYVVRYYVFQQHSLIIYSLRYSTPFIFISVSLTLTISTNYLLFVHTGTSYWDKYSSSEFFF